MTKQTVKVIEFLKDWQNLSYEQVESSEDVQVFNVIGVIIQLTSNGYMKVGDSFHFVSDNLSLDESVKVKIATVLANAHAESIIIN